MICERREPKEFLRAHMCREDKLRHAVSGNFNFSTSCEEATKGVRWMPWRQTPRKDAYHCDKPRGAVIGRHHPGVSEWGNPPGAEPGTAR